MCAVAWWAGFGCSDLGRTTSPAAVTSPGPSGIITASDVPAGGATVPNPHPTPTGSVDSAVVSEDRTGADEPTSEVEPTAERTSGQASTEPRVQPPGADSVELASHEPASTPSPSADTGVIDAGLPPLPDPGSEGDGDYVVGPSYEAAPELGDLGAPKGRRFEFSMRLAESRIFDGKDATLDPNKAVNSERSIVVYIPASYVDGTPAPVLVIQDGPGDLGLVQNALDNQTIAEDPARRLPPFIAIAVQNGGNDAQGSERGLEYDTMSDRYARFINDEVFPAVVAEPSIRDAYPKLRITQDPSGRATLGCSSGGVAGFTMAWFRPDLFSRVIAYSGTFVDQQDDDAPEGATYPDGAWGYHSNQKLIENTERQPLRVFLNVNENDLRSTDPESTLHNWVMANERTAAALASQGYHYRYVLGRGVGHCDGSVRRATLADALIWVWRGYVAEASL